MFSLGAVMALGLRFSPESLEHAGWAPRIEKAKKSVNSRGRKRIGPPISLRKCLNDECSIRLGKNCKETDFQWEEIFVDIFCPAAG